MQSSQRRCDPIKAVPSVPSSSMSSQAGQFGPNEWLVEEMYQRFLDDPTAVDPAWHDFFADYRPGDGDMTAATNGAAATAAPAIEARPAEQPAPEKSSASVEPPTTRPTNGAASAAPVRPAPEKP